MEWTTISTTAIEWVSANTGFIILGTVILMQWIAFQALLVHYHIFRKNLKKPRPDGLRFKIIDQNMKFHSEQIELVFEKLAEFKKEMGEWAIQDLQSGRRGGSVYTGAEPVVAEGAPSAESGFVSLGEINLKRRIAVLKNSGTSSTKTH